MNKSVINWQEAPSVLTGGKKSFWVAIDAPQGKRTVVWSQLKGKWIVLTDQMPPKGLSITVGLFNTPKEAKEFVELEATKNNPSNPPSSIV